MIADLFTWMIVGGAYDIAKRGERAIMLQYMSYYRHAIGVLMLAVEYAPGYRP